MKPTLFLYSIIASVLSTSSLHALDGGNDVYLKVPSNNQNIGWKTFEIITGGDALGNRAQEGFVWTVDHDDWDGLGAYRFDHNTLRVFINHEARANSTISRVDINADAIKDWIEAGVANNNTVNQVLPANPIVRTVSRGWLTVGSGINPVNNPCSGNIWNANTFALGRGFADDLYLFGEEVANIGKFWVMDLATRTLYDAVGLGLGKWENATPIDTGRIDTIAILLSEDVSASPVGSAPLRLYVGLKNPDGNFLERNGLASGQIYFWDPDGTSTNGTNSGIFSGGNGSSVNGIWTQTQAGAALISKSEDVHANMNPNSPKFGKEVALASAGEGVFVIDFSILNFVSGDLGSSRTSNIQVLFQAGTQASTNNFSGMDNLVWSADGMIYVNEDDGEGDVWRIDTDSLRASYAAGDSTPSNNQVRELLDADTISESSGIIDVSESLDYQPGSIFLSAGQSSTLANNQLILIVSPNAEKITPLKLSSIGSHSTSEDLDLIFTSTPRVSYSIWYSSDLSPNSFNQILKVFGSDDATSSLITLPQTSFGGGTQAFFRIQR